MPDADRAGQRFEPERLFFSLPSARRRVSLPASNVATPAES
jgi:hypothetical protein